MFVTKIGSATKEKMTVYERVPSYVLPLLNIILDLIDVYSKDGGPEEV